MPERTAFQRKNATLIIQAHEMIRPDDSPAMPLFRAPISSIVSLSLMERGGNEINKRIRTVWKIFQTKHLGN